MNTRSVLVSVIFLTGVATAFAGEPAPGIAAGSDTGHTQYASAKIKKNKKVLKPASMSKRDKQLNLLIDKACDAYWQGDIPGAASLIGRAGDIEPGNDDVIILQSKINRVMAVAPALSSRLTHYAQSTYEGGNALEALISLRSAIMIDKNNAEAEVLFREVSEAIEMEPGLENDNTRKKLRQALRDVSEKKYQKALAQFRSLDSRVARAGDYASIASIHMSDKENQRRSNAYYSRARDLFVQRRYNEAREQVMLSLAIDDANLDALILQEQIIMETVAE